MISANLNIPPKADGSFDPEAVSMLKEIGAWLDVNGDAIYGTSPWKTFGEGSVRYTTKGNNFIQSFDRLQINNGKWLIDQIFTFYLECRKFV